MQTGVFVGGVGDDPADTSNIQNSVLNGVLDGGTDLIVNTTAAAGSQTGNIFVNAPITNTTGGVRSLTLNAGITGASGGNITVNDAISGSSGNSLAATLSAPLGNVAFGGLGSISSFGGNVSGRAPTGTAGLGSIATGAGLLTVTAGTAIRQKLSTAFTVGGDSFFTTLGRNAPGK